MTAENDIHYERIQVKDLEQFASVIIEDGEPGQFVPITLQRARAHAHNPYADPQDIGLLLAVQPDGEVVGYFGILPVLLRVRDQFHKCYWFTTWSVSPKVRGRGVGSQLMREALALQKDFLIVGSVHARRVCRKFGFWERPPLTYYWIDPSAMSVLNPLTALLRLFRKLLQLLNTKKDININNRLTRTFDRLLSPLTRRCFYPLLSWRLAGILKHTYYRQIAEIQPNLPAGVHQPTVALHRGVEAINWMLAYPWVVTTNTSPTEEMDYYFSDSRPRHEFIAFELLDEKTKAYAGYVVFSLSQKKSGLMVKTLDYAIQQAGQYRQILALAVHLGRKHNAFTIEIPQEAAEALLGSLLGRLLLMEKSRIYQCYPRSQNSPLAKAWEDLDLRLYDGDMAFS